MRGSLQSLLKITQPPERSGPSHSGSTWPSPLLNCNPILQCFWLKPLVAPRSLRQGVKLLRAGSPAPAASAPPCRPAPLSACRCPLEPFTFWTLTLAPRLRLYTPRLARDSLSATSFASHTSPLATLNCLSLPLDLRFQGNKGHALLLTILIQGYNVSAGTQQPVKTHTIIPQSLTFACPPLNSSTLGIYSNYNIKRTLGNSLVVQWLRLCFPIQRAQFNPWSGS